MAEQSTNERPARAGEVCTCGRPATVVYLTENFGEVPYCGAPHVAPAVEDSRYLDYRAGYLAGRADERAADVQNRERLEAMLTKLERLHAEAEVERKRVAEMLTELRRKQERRDSAEARS